MSGCGLRVVRAEGVLPPPVRQPHRKIPPMVLRSEQAFWRALPELLKHRREQARWGRITGSHEWPSGGRLSTATQNAPPELAHEGIDLGKVEADPDGIPPWRPFKGDWTCYEVTEGTHREDA